jgi:competence protein ComGC
MVIRKLTRPLVSLLLISCLLLVTLPGVVSAAATTVTGGDGLRVSPVRSDITISPGQSQIVNLSVTNVQTVSATLQLSLTQINMLQLIA